MSVARTNWYSDQLPTLDLDDPFEVPVEDVGEPIDLSEPTARLNVRLQELVNREGQLDELGITCELKGRTGVVCSLCPVSQAANEKSPLGALCRVGQEQEAVCTQLAVGQHGAAPPK